MKPNFSWLINSLIPFLLVGIAAALIVGLVIVSAYVLVWGFFIGLILWTVALVKEYFFPGKRKIIRGGRIIEHDKHDH